MKAACVLPFGECQIRSRDDGNNKTCQAPQLCWDDADRLQAEILSSVLPLLGRLSSEVTRRCAYMSVGKRRTKNETRVNTGDKVSASHRVNTAWQLRWWIAASGANCSAENTVIFMLVSRSLTPKIRWGRSENGHYLKFTWTVNYWIKFSDGNSILWIMHQKNYCSEVFARSETRAHCFLLTHFVRTRNL